MNKIFWFFAFLLFFSCGIYSQLNVLYSPQEGIFRFRDKVKSCKETEFFVFIKGKDTTKIRKKQRPSDQDFLVSFNPDGKIAEQIFFDQYGKVSKMKNYFYNSFNELDKVKNVVYRRDSVITNGLVIYHYNADKKLIKKEISIKDSSLKTNKVNERKEEEIFILDSLGRKRKQQFFEEKEMNSEIIFTYDKRGDLTEEKWFKPVGKLKTVTTFSYDALHRCIEIASKKNPDYKMQFKYAATVYPVEETYYYDGKLGYKQQFIRDKYDNKTETHRSELKKPKSILKFNYEYDLKGNWIKNSVTYQGRLMYIMYREFEYY